MGLRETSMEREERCPAIKSHTAEDPPRSAGVEHSWDAGTVLLTPGSLHFQRQSCSNFWPDLLASPLTPRCQSAFCSLPPELLPNCNNCRTPQLILIPAQQCSCQGPSALPQPLLSLFSALLVYHFLVSSPYFLCLINGRPFRYLSETKRMTSLAYTIWSQEKGKSHLWNDGSSHLCTALFLKASGLIHWWVPRRFTDLQKVLRLPLG